MTQAKTVTTGSLVSTERDRGAAVYNPTGENIGTIRDVLIDKGSGSALYAIIAFDGAFALGKLHPVPWELLTHRDDRGGFIVDLSALELENGPTLIGDGAGVTLTADIGRRVDEFYNLPSYWVDSTDRKEEPRPFVGLRAL